MPTPVSTASSSSTIQETSASVPPPALSSFRIFAIWFGLGLQSFGGGGATLTLIHRAAVEQYKWLTAEEFAREWALCLFAPGINLVAMTILIGRRIAGWRGIFLSLGGMLLPSVTITIVLTALYARIRNLAIVQAALRAVIPATVGLGLLTAYSMLLGPLRTSLRTSRREGMPSLVLTVVIVAGSAAASFLFHVPVVAILALSGVAGAVFYSLRHHRSSGAGRQP